METFNYTAKDPAGKTIKGQVEARSEKHAVQILKEREFFVINLVRQSGNRLKLPFTGHIGSKEVMQFTQQLNTMLNAGMPLTDAFQPHQADQMHGKIQYGDKCSLPTSIGRLIFEKRYEVPWIFEIKPLSPKAGAGNLIFCELLKMHVHPSVLNESGKIDPAKLNPVARLGGDWYCEVSAANLMEVEKPSRIPGIGIDQLPESIRNSDLLRGNELGMLGNTEKIPDKEEALPRLTQVEEWKSIQTEPELHAEIRNLLHSGNKPDAIILAFYGHRLLP
jgi:hypothetical protein